MDKIALNLAFSFSLALFVLFFITSIGFIFHIPIQKFYPFISILTLYLTLYLYSKKNKFTNTQLILSLYISIILLVLCGWLACSFWDNSWDGQRYHQNSILLLANGWNPIYDDINLFCKKIYNLGIIHPYRCECYPKFSEIIAANIFHITDNIESGKIVNLISMLIMFFYSFYVLSGSLFTKLSNKLKVIISFLLVYNPVVICQIFTYYNDFLLYFYFMILVLAILDIEQNSHGWGGFAGFHTCLQ